MIWMKMIATLMIMRLLLHAIDPLSLEHLALLVTYKLQADGKGFGHLHIFVTRLTVFIQCSTQKKF